MFALSTVLLAGGIAYTGSLTYRRLRDYRKRLTRARSTYLQSPATVSPAHTERVRTLVRADRTVTASSLALGLTVAGVFMQPVLMVVSVPTALVIFAPTLRDAWQALRRERRITPSVLDATRVVLCVSMGFYFALALDTWLRTLAQRLMVRSEAELQELIERYAVAAPATVWCFRAGAEVQTPLAELAIGDVIAVEAGDLIPATGTIRYGDAWIDEQLVTGQADATHKGAGETVFAMTVVQRGQIYLQVTTLAAQPGMDIVRERLAQMLDVGSYLTAAGERSGRSMAPKMLATFALLLPFWEANRAAGFLTTSFGSQMNRLGPYALQNFATVALQQNLLIQDGRALEALNLVNTVMIDATLMADATLREQALAMIAALRGRRWPMQSVTPQPFAIYLLAERDEAATKTLAAMLGVDDYFVEPSALGRAELLERLKIGGRMTCYIGSGAEDATVLAKALVAVAIPSANATLGESAVQEVWARLHGTTAQVVLLEKDLQRIPQLFALAMQFGLSQGVNLAWPLLMDLVDITTTVFVHFGLTYSILFSYSGLLGGALHTRLPLVRYLRKQQQPPPVEPIAPEHQLTTAMPTSHA